jgi:polyprenyl-phospho-N-acetylgalactosaminyl synthase
MTSLTRSDRIWVVVPAFNEQDVIGKVVCELTAAYANVVVVDDGSVDLTMECARRHGAVVCRHPINLGQGAALQTGITFALRQQAEVIVTFDADGQHQVTDIARLIQALEVNDAAVALGSRFLGRAVSMPLSRRLLLRAVVLFTRLTTRLKVTDAHNGLRAFRADAARQITIHQDRMAHASEILEQIARLRLRYVEVPVTIVYTAYSKRKGQSMINTVNILIDLLTQKIGT